MKCLGRSKQSKIRKLQKQPRALADSQKTPCLHGATYMQHVDSTRLNMGTAQLFYDAPCNHYAAVVVLAISTSQCTEVLVSNLGK